MRRAIVCLLLWGATAAVAQPGYMGKKTVVGIEALAYPAFGDYWAFNGIHGYRVLPSLNRRVGVVARRALSRIHTVGGAAYYIDAAQRYEYFDSLTSVRALGKLAYQAYAVHATMRWYTAFNAGSLAPIGLYHQADVFLMRYSARDLTGRYPHSAHDFQPMTDYGVAYTLGLQHVFWKNLTYDVGMQTALPLGYLRYRFNLRSGPTLSQPRAAMASRMMFQYIFNLKAGIGVIF
jgi:hypothetical protein